MRDDPTTMAQLKAELRELRALYVTSQGETAATREIPRALAASSSIDLQGTLGEIARAARQLVGADDVIVHGQGSTFTVQLPVNVEAG